MTDAHGNVDAAVSHRWGLSVADVRTRVTCDKRSAERAVTTRKRFIAQRCDASGETSVGISQSQLAYIASQLTPWECSAVELYRYIQSRQSQQPGHAPVYAKEKAGIVCRPVKLCDTGADATRTDLDDAEKRLLLMLYSICHPPRTTFDGNIGHITTYQPAAPDTLYASPRNVSETAEQTDNHSSSTVLLHLFAQRKLRSCDDVTQSAAVVCDWMRGWVVAPDAGAQLILPRTFLRDVAVCLARTHRLRAIDMPTWLIRVFEGMWSYSVDMNIVRRNAIRWDVGKCIIEAVYALQFLDPSDQALCNLSVRVFLHALNAAGECCNKRNTKQGVPTLRACCEMTAKQDAWCEVILCLCLLLKQHPNFALSSLTSQSTEEACVRSTTTSKATPSAPLIAEWQANVRHAVDQIGALPANIELVTTILLNDLLFQR